MAFGVTLQGFKRKTYPDIIADMEARAKSLFGEDINLSERSPMGLWIRLHAWEVANLWEQAEVTYNAGYKDTSEGVQLHHVGKYIGIYPKQPVKAIGQIVITGDTGTVIPLGFAVSTSDGIQFVTTVQAEIGAGGTATVNIEAVQAGQGGNVSPNTITEIINPTAGVTAVNNPEETKGGLDMESDDQFKIRYDRSVSRGGSSTATSIEATLLSLAGVRDAIVEENQEITEVNSIPPKSVAPFVFGGDDNEIAQAIFNVKAGGIRSYGNIVVSVTDSKGKVHQIGFSRPTEVNIWCNITLATDSNFPPNGKELVRTEVIKYIGGIDADGTDYDGLGLDNDVILIKIIGVAQVVPGITDMQVQLSTDGVSFAAANIPIENRSIARTDSAKVVVA